MAKSFQFGRRVGLPRQVGDNEITPESFVLQVQLGNFGYVWNSPVAVSVALRNGRGDLQVERHAIVDVTRLLLWLLWGTTALMLLAALFGPFFLRARKRKHL